MALFKIAKGAMADLKTNCPNTTDGYCYVAKDQDANGNDRVYFLVDLATATNDTSARYTLSAEYAQSYPVTIKEWT
jgi:hypothetical protein